MVKDDIIYSVEIKGRECGFFIQFQEDGKILLIVPDVGGQADMVPRIPEQLEWLAPKLESFRGVKRIWDTVWEIESEDTLEAIDKFFKKYGKLSEKARVDFY